MKPTITTSLAFGLLFLGIIAVLSIVILQGRDKKPKHTKFLRWAHRITGYIFLVLYIFICVVMFRKITHDSVQFFAKDVVHAYTGLIIFPLLVAKICIARSFKKYYPRLPVFGIIVMVAVYLAVTLNGSYYLLSLLQSKYITIKHEGKLVEVNITAGRKVVQRKCTSCHSLERVYSNLKTASGWREYVARMQAKDPQNLSEKEELQALGFLIRNLGIDESKMSLQVGMKIVLNKCNKCHTLERVFKNRRTKSEWGETIELMRSFDPQLLTDSEARQVKYYLRTILLKQEKES